jgi:hypothetical protein
MHDVFKRGREQMVKSFAVAIGQRLTGHLI